MDSLHLQTAARFLQPLLLLFSIFLLMRGHNEPGGGFLGGLMAASAFVLNAIAFDAQAARRVLRVEERTLIGAGLLLATLSGTVALFEGRPFLSGVWWNVPLPGVGRVALGTPLLFDVGVYLVVIGITLKIILTLEETGGEKR